LRSTNDRYLATIVWHKLNDAYDAWVRNINLCSFEWNTHSDGISNKDTAIKFVIENLIKQGAILLSPELQILL
jgi:hypothetical protein